MKIAINMPPPSPQDLQQQLQMVQAIVAEFHAKLAELKKKQKRVIDRFGKEGEKRKIEQIRKETHN